MNEASEVLVHVRRGDEFLVAHRAPDGGGYWHAIAGGVEPGEEWEAAARRELQEETGLAAASLQALGGFSYVPKGWEHARGPRVEVRAFLVDVEPGWEPELDHEHDDYRWCSREDAMALLFWPEPAELLRELP